MHTWLPLDNMPKILIYNRSSYPILWQVNLLYGYNNQGSRLEGLFFLSIFLSFQVTPWIFLSILVLRSKSVPYSTIIVRRKTNEKRYTYPKMLSFDKDLWHKYSVRSQPLRHFTLNSPVHEDITFVISDHKIKMISKIFKDNVCSFCSEITFGEKLNVTTHRYFKGCKK
ncbi:hypothetical protein GQR58_015886 [Nymphon striatum]|nr:hypothetical protein GQR58_015886 [Nymphon striatum]